MNEPRCPYVNPYHDGRCLKKERHPGAHEGIDVGFSFTSDIPEDVHEEGLSEILQSRERKAG